MKTYHQLSEEVQSHDDYSKWHTDAQKHPDFSHFVTSDKARLKEFGSKKLTVYAMDHQSNPLGVYSHAFGRGNLTYAGK